MVAYMILTYGINLSYPPTPLVPSLLLSPPLPKNCQPIGGKAESFIGTRWSYKVFNADLQLNLNWDSFVENK